MHLSPLETSSRAPCVEALGFRDDPVGDSRPSPSCRGTAVTGDRGRESPRRWLEDGGGNTARGVEAGALSPGRRVLCAAASLSLRKLRAPGGEGVGTLPAESAGALFRHSGPRPQRSPQPGEAFLGTMRKDVAFVSSR